ncbi:MAG TPA: hypothetical protein VLQ93_01380, partial [Myxococcaceae bacterium]|nr:hypothetical protein [Myxococcaceae bacterium]
MRDYSFFRRLMLLALLWGGACTRSEEAAETPGEEGEEEVSATLPCVHFEELRRFLPETLAGMTRTRDGGSSGRYGEVSVSEVERLFNRGEEREVKVRIVDTTLGEQLGQAIRAAAEEARGRAPSDPTAPIFWGDTVGFVRHDEASSLAEASLLVGGRYVVAVTSRGFPGTVEVRRVARGMTLEGLARLHQNPSP